MVLLSTTTFVLQTLPSFEEGSDEFPVVVKALEIVDEAAVIFFTAEYLIRFICSPVKMRFFKRFALNLNPVQNKFIIQNLNVFLIKSDYQ